MPGNNNEDFLGQQGQYMHFYYNIFIIAMGNTCQSQNQCCQAETTNRLRQSKQKNMLNMSTLPKIGLKDLVQIKKTPISQDYVILSPPIGKGSFGSVYKIVNKQSGMEWAAKKIPITRNMQKHIQEILILKQLDHPNIIRIIDVYQEQLFVYVVMEICHGGQLFDRIVQRENMNENMAKIYMQQLLSAVAYCHMNRIIHRDLKPENIMMISSKEDTIKIIDFGASTVHKKGQINSLKVGSVYYIAPEVINKSYNEKCDIWSLGVILYMMLSGIPPFNGRTDKAIFQKILQGKLNFPQKQWSNISEQAKDLVTKMLQFNPQKRLSARQALTHPWLLIQKKQQKNLYLSNQLTKIKQFCTMNKFKQSIMTFVTHNLSTAQSLQKMRNHFQKIDKNNDGRISWKQFQQCYIENIGPIANQQLLDIFGRLDKNQSGYIDYSEFVASAMSNQLLSSREMVEKAFDMIDKDKDGCLNKQQILLALGGVQQALYQQMLQQCDVNQDGLISREEFMVAMLSISQSRIKNNMIGNNSTKGSNTGAI